jgi:DNA-binding beta-propeller fold protein YncE
MIEMVARLRPARSAMMVATLVMAAAIGIRVAPLSEFGSVRATEAAEPMDAAPGEDQPNPSPVDLVLTPDEERAVTVNQQSDSLALVDLTTGVVLSKAACGEHPSHLVLTPDGGSVLATAAGSGELFRFGLANDRLEQVGRLNLGREPRGVVVSPDGKLAYVALSAAAAVAVIDLENWRPLDEISVGRWPRFLALSPDGRRLAVGCSGDRGVVVVDTERREQLYLERFAALNLGQMHVSADGTYVYFPWIVSRQFAITEANIRRGWVLASRIARVRLDVKTRREAISLDPQGRAVGDPHGLALSPDEQTLVCTASGTHELLVYRLPGLPFKDSGGPEDHIDPELLKDRDRFDRIELGGRPLAVRYSKHGDRVFVVNSLLNAIQVVDVNERRIEKTIPLGGPSSLSLARRGEVIFHDARRSLDQWYSCHSCHYEGGGQAVTIDTRNDGRTGNPKTVVSLRGASDTGPWFWHGWADDLHTAVRQSMTDTMLGNEPTHEDVEAVVAYIRTLAPRDAASGELSDAAARGRAVFEREKAGCANCHPAPHFTDKKLHDVGLGSPEDFYPTYNTPSLVGVSRRVLFLHDGRARSLRDVLTGPHNPSAVTALGELSDDELKDLLAYLESL